MWPKMKPTQPGKAFVKSAIPSSIIRAMLDTGTETSCFTLVNCASGMVSRMDHRAFDCVSLCARATSMRMPRSVHSISAASARALRASWVPPSVSSHSTYQGWRSRRGSRIVGLHLITESRHTREISSNAVSRSPIRLRRAASSSTAL